MIESVYRVKCEGACRGWLRKGRTTPPHWGEQYAEVFGSAQEAQKAMQEAGWVNGLCPKERGVEVLADEAVECECGRTWLDGKMGPGHNDMACTG